MLTKLYSFRIIIYILRVLLLLTHLCCFATRSLSRLKVTDNTQVAVVGEGIALSLLCVVFVCIVFSTMKYINNLCMK